ncbi:MAG TPA: hypothetical protein VGP73_01605 [Thermoanaerobaculia bacterium]
MPPSTPRLFRLILPVSDGEKALGFYSRRSFYAVDPFGHRLCFVDETTLFTGR